MKNYEEFKSSVVERIANYCAKIGKRATVRLLENGLIAHDEETRVLVEDTNRKYGHIDSERLVGDYVILALDTEKDGGYQCRFAVKALFKMYHEGGWETVEHAITENIQQVETIDQSVFERLEKYDQIRDKLLLCMRNARSNDVERRGMTFRRIDDMAMTLYAIVKDDGQGNRLIVPVLRHYVHKWGISDEEIFNAALENTVRLSPPRIYIGAEGWVPGGEGFDFMNIMKPLRKLPQGLLSGAVTTLPNSDGAIAMYYPGVCERLAEMADGDFYAVFTAKDECHVHRADSVTANLLKERLADMNRQFSSTMLTEYVYRYRAKKKILQKVL
ncbi:MAG: hypothetical protein IKG86_00665 [Paludibacteraceae bacterium]|nr:hypothetical protein [Paludibacteraceae bacterium]